MWFKRHFSLTFLPRTLVGLFSLLVYLHSNGAIAQEKINLLVEARFLRVAQDFLSKLQEQIDPAVGLQSGFTVKTVSSSEVEAAMAEKAWTMAIVNSQILEEPSSYPALAFAVPFLFGGMSEVIDYQESALGRSGLSSQAERGISSLVYLNAGNSYLASNVPLATPEDIKGLKVAVQPESLPEIQDTLSALGGSSIAMSWSDTMPALQMGAVDIAIVETEEPRTWSSISGSYLIENSLDSKVAVVAVNDKNWDILPFEIRASIGDAAIEATRKINDELIHSEIKFRSFIYNNMGKSLKFDSDDAAYAVDQWISKQPVNLQGGYKAINDNLRLERNYEKNSPVIPDQRGDAGHIYFATTRNDTQNIKLSYRFGDRRTNVTKCGELTFDISGTATILGEVIAGNEDCSAYLVKLLQEEKQTLLFVHGFNNRFSDATERAVMLKKLFGPETSVLMWSWPARRDALGSNYRYDKESASGVAQILFRDTLQNFSASLNGHPINILAHSMGGWHTMGALQGIPHLANEPRFKNIVMAAPDIPSDEFEFALEKLSKQAERLTLYACKSDWALEISEVWNQHDRAGTGGNNIIVGDKLESIDVDSRLLSSNHSYVFDSQIVREDFALLIGENKSASERALIAISKGDYNYWKYP
ncbi:MULTISPECIES: TRAP transporter substrate-binding protein DctP [Thalassospira]|uniref:TRAP transporter substrate-binding protein DctP n=1 Tax=Thalassospira TaxID=168934 RepID=UPI0008DCA77F|nr:MULTISPECIES: TRAP transporter substrate-binding protein DctP [Thalassospira]MAB33811.1 hypothetical protein [Thalassospira sp.]MDM7977091.1 TRAP transporter substrate-binding protein DctP [Thalassospira xiamenensis]OHZ01444.1 hypothetical protein BC440_20650 [Thalassospira sp. MIT1004]HBS21078.1 alpha/beta hydrolase [Thalassospira sp.]